MLKKNIKYTDFNGIERDEPFYFNLTEAEIMEMEMGTVGGYAEFIQKVIDTQDQVQLIKIFKEFILKAVGEKSDDGKKFRKSAAIAEDFASTAAYSVLFMELATNTEAAIEFINGLAPKGSEEITAEKAKQFLETKMR